ncbi:18S rRNA (guanine1575-n7)-methyltransferase [Plakobranchus ocellatus]|uniref:18S rRNA (Guanine1575-n7)-methyltransferase n=1 Tax=Plakobranchus ocellatus TaxID=259542 RepID=A0AAV3YPS3_9GAST|nr:18S rRNA (guanine1575-n7)-methyltransferase [Plakobranchus ocellatus]
MVPLLQSVQRHLLAQYKCTVLVIQRYKKRYASLHNQDLKAFILPSTCHLSLCLPPGIKVCKNLSEFKLKNLKGGFQRRPELICQRNASSIDSKVSCLGSDLSVTKSTKKIERIQQELVAASLRLLGGIKFSQASSDLAFLLQGLDTHEELQISPPPKHEHPIIVDIGCGNGYNLKPLVDMGYPCIGIDLDLSGLQKTRTNLLSIKTKVKSAKKDSKLSSFATDHNGSDDFYNNLVSFNSTEYHNLHQLNSHNSENIYLHRTNTSICTAPLHFIQTVSAAADVVRWDLRHGFPFKPNSFDLAISISFLQWLFYGKTDAQLSCFFAGLKSILRPGGKAVIQFYPQNLHQLESAIQHANSYFQGVLVGDYPHLDRGRKLFLILFLPESKIK